MSDIVKIATRESYGKAVTELGREHEEIIVLDADLAEATKTAVFRKEFPERHIDCGIAEANMIGIAAGLAAAGKVPFASSFAMFATGRAFEQIRNSVGYPHLNVKICASHAGLTVGEDGATHQCNEDIALMRTIPGMTVIVPSDDIETRAAVKAAYEYKGPVYIRLRRFAVPVINTNEDYVFEMGRGIKLADGSDVSIIATGLMVSSALDASRILEENGISASVVNIHTIKPIDRDIILSEARKTGRIVTAEEHSVIGGLGSAVAETVCEGCPVPVHRVGMNDVYGESGPAADLLVRYGLDGKGLADNIMAWMKE